MFRAHDPVEGRLVAVKAFRLDLTPERAAELAEALQALAARGLSHPSIAAPIAAGVEDDIAWFAQAYVPAESLDTALRQYGPPPVADALTIVTQLAGALDFAAAAGVVHGSLHPRDVLVSPGETHLVDLGVAAALDACGVRAPVRRPYSAPERGAGRPVSREGDIFALGAIAFELLGGQPVIGVGDEAVGALPDVPGANREALLETFSFALALAPDERYATALAFAAPLKKALGDALTRPAAPRRRRTTRPPEMLLPVSDLDSEPAPAPLDGFEPVEHASAPPETDSSDFDSFREALAAFPTEITPAPADVPAGPGVTTDPDETARSMPADTAEGMTGLTRSSSLGPRKAALEPEAAEPPPAYLSGPTEPEPSAPAVEPIVPTGIVAPPRSPLDSAAFDRPAEPLMTWDAADTDPEQTVSQPAGGPPEDIEDEPRSRYGTAEDEAFTPVPGADDSTSRPRAAWVPLAAMLLIGFVAGLAGGWWLFGGGARRPPADTEASAAAGAGAEARPREFTDDAVPAPEAGNRVATAAKQAPPSAPAPAPARPEARAAPAAAAPPRAAPPPRGRLVIRTLPAGARVEVDGRSRGESPVTLTDLSLGRHTVRVSEPGYGSEQRRVTLSARRSARTLDVTMRRSAAPVARAPQETSTFTGTLVVESRPPGAKVFLDGRGVGVTPLTMSEVKAGSHVVRIELVGYRRWSKPVRIVSGERERVAASLEEEPPP